MFIWYWVEICLMILLPLIIVTQIAVPAWKNTPTFPLIRKIFSRKRKVEEKIRELKVAKEVKGLETTAVKLERELQEDKSKRRKSAK